MLLRLRGARSRFEGPIGSFSMYVCGLGDVRTLFFRENTAAGSDSAYGLRRAKVGFGTDGAFSVYVSSLGDVRVLCCIYTVRNLHVCDCILVLRMVLLFLMNRVLYTRFG